MAVVQTYRRLFWYNSIRFTPSYGIASRNLCGILLIYNIFRYAQINKYQPQLIASMG